MRRLRARSLATAVTGGSVAGDSLAGDDDVDDVDVVDGDDNSGDDDDEGNSEGVLKVVRTAVSEGRVAVLPLMLSSWAAKVMASTRGAGKSSATLCTA